MLYNSPPSKTLILIFWVWEGKRLDPIDVPAEGTINIANGGHHVIWVLVSNNEEVVRRSTEEFRRRYVNPEGEPLIVRVTDRIGFDLVYQGSFKTVEPQTEHVYVSIFYQDRGDKADSLPCASVCSSITLTADENIVIGYDNQVHRARLGSIWIDNEGNDRFRHRN